MTVTIILLSIFFALVAAIFYLTHRNSNYWQRRGIPCDSPHWLAGSLKGIPKTLSIAEVFAKIYKRYKGSGPFCGVYVYLKPSVLVLTSELAKRVLIKDGNNFIDRGVYYNEKDDPLTANLFALDGHKWRVMRTKLTPTFTSGQMRYMYPNVLSVAKQFIASLSSELERSNIIEITDIMARFTTDVIGSCAFGIECNSLQNPNSIFRVMGRRVFTNRRHSKLVEGVISSVPNLARKLRARILSDEIHKFFLNIVRDAVDYRVKNNVQRKDFLSILMKLNKGNVKCDANTDGKGLTVEQMAAQAYVFFVGGFETSSSTLAFMFYELAQNPTIQQRMREEIVYMLAQNDNEVTYEYINSMPYMQQVIAETLRKYPILPFLQRKALADYIVPDHPKYFIEKGTNVFIPSKAMHHDPEIYPEPEKFNPERFSSEQMQLRDSINWLPFGEGPRKCIGIRFGQMQMRIALIYLLRNFEFSTCELTEMPPQLDNSKLVTCSKNGIYLKVQRI